MEAPMVVGMIEVARKRSPRIFEVGVVANANFFIFERAHEAFANGIVRRRSGSTHANVDSPFAQDREVIVSAVRSAAVGVMNESRARRSTAQRHLQCLDR